MKIQCVWEHNGNDSILYANNYVGVSRASQITETAEMLWNI